MRFNSVEINGEAQLYALEKAAVRLFRLINTDAFQKTPHKFFLFRTGEFMIQYIKTQQKLIEVISGNFLLLADHRSVKSTCLAIFYQLME